jgi:autophagy-related protein 18
MNRRRLVVILKEQIFVYDISNMKLLHTTETNANLQGKLGAGNLKL